MAFQKIRSRFHSKKVLALVVILLIATVLAVLELTNTTHLFHDAPKAESGKIPVKEVSKTASSKSSKTKAASTPSSATPDSTVKNNSGGGGASGAALQAPFGSFVSSHSPSLGSASGEESVCITTPGATCTITFTNSDGVVKTLPAQTTNSNGNATWDWDVKTAGFTEGSWTIKVTATLNGQTQSVTDKLPLKVQP